MSGARKTKLVFKGDKSGEKRQKVLSTTLSLSSSSSSSSTKAPAAPAKSHTNEDQIELRNGTGKITSSGTTIQGSFTVFQDELSVGDALIITHPTTHLQEPKIVRMVLSHVSIGISSAFSSDLISTTPFRYIKAPKDDEEEAKRAKQEKQKQDESEEMAFGTYASKGGREIVFQERKAGSFGSYVTKVIKESSTGSKSREELLDFRAKKKSDKYC